MTKDIMAREANAGEALVLLRDIIHAEAFDMPRPAFTATDAIDIANEGLKDLGLMKAELAHLRAKVTIYEKRLEVDHVYVMDDTGRLIRQNVPVEERTSMYDAVSCRDSTIMLVESFNEKLKKELKDRRWRCISTFHDGYKPLFYVGSNSTIDSCEVYKYKGYIPEHVKYFLPLDSHGDVIDMEEERNETMEGSINDDDEDKAQQKSDARTEEVKAEGEGGVEGQ